MTFENDARIGAFLKFIDWRARLSNLRYRSYSKNG
jgi:hypothetical protein